ncbi:hypothetical protein GEMRC1_000535 [Eukaryota sp. GEM-RC1]
MPLNPFRPDHSWRKDWGRRFCCCIRCYMVRSPRCRQNGFSNGERKAQTSTRTESPHQPQPSIHTSGLWNLLLPRFHWYCNGKSFFFPPPPLTLSRHQL